MDAFVIEGTVTHAQAKELIRREGWDLHAVVEQDGRPMTLIRAPEDPRLRVVDDPKDPPGPWPDA